MACATGANVRRVFKDAGRVCPADYRIAPNAFTGPCEHEADVLYVVGGLYGNPFALRAVEGLMAAEDPAHRTLAVFNGDMHWFDKAAENFEAIERAAAGHVLLVGNVEAELRRQESVGVGCGCAYPECTPDDAVSRSNRIHLMLSRAVGAHPALKRMLVGRPSTTTVSVAGRRVCVTHGDEQLVGGWGCSRESLADVLRQDELETWLERTGASVLACTHTCSPAALMLPHGAVINNGAVGLPNYAGQRFGLVTRIARTPHPDALVTGEADGLFVELVPVRYDHGAFLAWFDALWPRTSPAAISYRSRIVDGPADCIAASLLGGFREGPAAGGAAGRVLESRKQATEGAEMALASLVYFEDMLPEGSPRETVAEPSIMQANITARCNLACEHCHVGSNPARTEAMDDDVLEAVLKVARDHRMETIDITGGAPELHPRFAWFLRAAAKTAPHVIVRTNLVVLDDAEHAPLIDLYADLGVEVVASVPSVFAAEADKQRGGGVFDRSVKVLRKLNACGYGCDGRHILTLAFNPQYPVLPPEESPLDELYRRRLGAIGISFDRVIAMANCPIGRYAASLAQTGELDGYLETLLDSFNPDTAEHFMCRDQLSVGWGGEVYDCDFNQALRIPAHDAAGAALTVFDYAADPARSLVRPLRFGNHCYSCAAGCGSSCGGTLVRQ